jgi:hypothetical protein
VGSVKENKMSTATLAIEAAQEQEAAVARLAALGVPSAVEEQRLAKVTAAKARLLAMTVAEVQSVYSGKPGCACGCRGNHRYNSQHVASASKNRGYAVTPEEVNDRQVKKVLEILKANTDVVANNYVNDGGDSNNFYAELENGGYGSLRLYIVYPVKENS